MEQEPQIGMRPRRRRHRSRQPGGGRRSVPGRAQGTARQHDERAHLEGSPRAADRRLRDGLRSAQSDLDLPIHRHDPAGGVLPRGAGAARRRRRPRAFPARRPGSQHRRSGRREPGMEAGPGGRTGHHPRVCWTPTTPSGIPSLPGCCRTPWPQVALSNADDRHAALRDTMTELLSMDEPRRRIAGMLCALDIHYDLGEGHPLLGRRMPDLDVHTADGPTRVFALLHDARPVLLNLGAPGGFDIAPWASRVRLVDATHDGAWELPVIGEVAAPPAVLIRPDGHVAWTGHLTDPRLPEALATWFGAPAH